MLLKRAKCVVVPVGIAGVYEVWPRHRSLPRVFAKPVAIVYGDPITTEELLENGADEAIKSIQKRVETLVARAEELRR